MISGGELLRARYRSSSSSRSLADAVDVLLLRSNALLRRPVPVVIAVLAATDVAYRLLLRESVRRALGMRD